MSAVSQPMLQRPLDMAADAEGARQAALDRYQVLSTPAEPAFDRIVRLAALLLDVPIALISLVDLERQWFKARVGLDAQETPRTIAFCDHAIRGHDVMVVPDAELDARFSTNPLVTGDPHVRFYAGAPLVTPDGFALGTLCAIDRAPRQLNARDSAILAGLAEQVVHELEVRAALGELYKEVAEGRRTARTLQGEGARLEALLNATGNAVVSADGNGCVASLNRNAEAMFGLAPGEAVGWPISRLMTTDIDPADADTEACKREGVGLRKDGSAFPIEVSGASWTDAHGHPASGAILRDITARRRAEAEERRRAEAERMQDKLAALGRTAGGVAHELNNLLQPVIGLAELELDAIPSHGTPAQNETRENLAMIMECGNQMRAVVRKILMFARKAKPERVNLDFPAALDRTVGFVSRLLPPEVYVDVVVDSAAGGQAKINEAELVEVITNLAVNGAHAMQNAGTLSIRLDRVDLDRAAAKPIGVTAGSYFTLTVSDAGHGMDDATTAQVFEPFFTTKPVGQGTGLGLSMVYGVLQDWNGTIAIASAAHVGTTFTLYIPVASP